MVGSLNLGAPEQTAPPKMAAPKGLGLNLPVKEPEGAKVPSLNIGIASNTTKPDDQASSQRKGLGMLNIGKAVAIQQESIKRTEDTIMQAQKIADVEEAPPKKPGMGLGGMGLNLANFDKV